MEANPVSLPLLLQLSRYPRRTISFGGKLRDPESGESVFVDNLFIRELPVIAGWVGCGVWDAAVMMARYFLRPVAGSAGNDADRAETSGAVTTQVESLLPVQKPLNGEFMQGLAVLELGSGAGLVGLVAGRFAQTVVLTDYSTAILDNLEYNIWLNSQNLDEERLLDLFPESRQARETFQRNGRRLAHAARVAYLDWYRPEAERKPPDVLEPTLERRLPPGGYRCIIPGGAALGKFPVIIGSELTYQLPGVEELANVVDLFLEEGGVFWEIISIYRGPGPRKFMRLMRERGWAVEAREPPPQLSESIDSVQSRARHEKYLLWTLYRKNDTPKYWPDYPRFGSGDLVAWDTEELDSVAAVEG